MPSNKDKGANVPALRGGPQLPAEYADQFHDLAGAGTQGIGREDLLMPRLTLLQKLSPQLNNRKAEFVEGAKEGQIINTATNKLFDKVHLIPVAYQRRHLEWRPNRGGLAADHGLDSSILAQTEARPSKTGRGTELMLPNGNEIVVVGTWYCLNLTDGASQCFLGLGKSSMKASRRWMTMATSERVSHPEHGLYQPPLFYRSYEHAPIIQSSADHEWWGWHITPKEDILQIASEMPSIVTEARLLMDAIKSGSVMARAEAFGEPGDAGGPSDEDSF